MESSLVRWSHTGVVLGEFIYTEWFHDIKSKKELSRHVLRIDLFPSRRIQGSENHKFYRAPCTHTAMSLLLTCNFPLWINIHTSHTLKETVKEDKDQRNLSRETRPEYRKTRIEGYSPGRHAPVDRKAQLESFEL